MIVVSRTGRRGRGEQGVFLVLWAVMLLALLLMVAIVVDLGALRADRRTARSAADAAAVAGGADLFAGAELACETAWNYAVQNVGKDITDPTLTPPPCSDFATITCNPSAIETRTGIAGEYTIAISNPVPNGDPLMDAEAVGANIDQVETTSDGDACDRLGVKITRSRETLFARVAGHSSNTTGGHSVGLVLSGIEGVPASLVVLDPTRCPAISSSGNGGIEVTGTSATLVGAILAVSDASHADCSATTPVLDVQTGATLSHITVTDPGDIYLTALTGGSCTSSPKACNPTQNSATTGYSPAPKRPKDPPDRGLVDYKYNCLGGYSSPTNYRTVFHRGVSGDVLPACGNPAAGYVNAAMTAFRGNALRPTTIPPANIFTGGGFCSGLPATISGNAKIECRVPNGHNLTVTGDLWISNTQSIAPGALIVNGNAVFGGGVGLGTGNLLRVNGNAEFQSGDVSVSGAGVLEILGNPTGFACDAATLLAAASAATCVRSSSPDASFVYLRSGVGTFGLNGGTVNLSNTTVFADDASNPSATPAVYSGPKFNIGGGGTVTWLAPSAGPFEHLLAWSDKVTNYQNNGTFNATSHSLSGGGTVTIDGIFFTPTAGVQFTGNTSITPQRAQFWANTLHQDGGGTFVMTPDGSFIPVPVAQGSRLIR